MMAMNEATGIPFFIASLFLFSSRYYAQIGLANSRLGAGRSRSAENSGAW